jgi:Ca2+-binding EF-hand superfamily protein
MGKKELQELFSSVSTEMTDEQFETIFMKLDCDKTGWVSFEEFAMGALHFRSQVGLCGCICA